MTIPDELAEAARVDGAMPMRFFIDIVVPMIGQILLRFLSFCLFMVEPVSMASLITTDQNEHDSDGH